MEWFVVFELTLIYCFCVIITNAKSFHTYEKFNNLLTREDASKHENDIKMFLKKCLREKLFINSWYRPSSQIIKLYITEILAIGMIKKHFKWQQKHR